MKNLEKIPVIQEINDRIQTFYQQHDRAAAQWGSRYVTLGLFYPFLARAVYIETRAAESALASLAQMRAYFSEGYKPWFRGLGVTAMAQVAYPVVSEFQNTVYSMLKMRPGESHQLDAAVNLASGGVSATISNPAATVIIRQQRDKVGIPQAMRSIYGDWGQARPSTL